MLLIVGWVIVLGCVIGGYAMVHGPFHMLLQPSELLTILGGSIGAMVASSSGFSMKLTLKGFGHALGNGPNKAKYTEMLALLYGLFAKMQREGIISIEKDIEAPSSSPLFQRFPLMSKDKTACFFIGDTLRIYLTTGNAGELDKLMGVDLEAMHGEEELPIKNIEKMAEALPGMGIVAAVMGVVVTMSMINEPPEVLGHHIGAALVGTFLGILLSYGIFAPIANKLEALAHEQHLFFRAIKEAVGAAVRGSSPIVALEYGRRAIPLAHRPSFTDMESSLKGG